MEQQAVMSSDDPKNDDGNEGLQNMAISMYAARRKTDHRRGKDYLHDGEHARALYFRGVHDTILALEEWTKTKVKQSTLAVLLQTLHDQTKEDPTVN